MAESQNIEYKESWRDEYLKWVCGFANAQGGIIYIGIDDVGNVVGVKNIKKLMEDIPNKIQSGLGIVADVNKLEKDGKEYLEIKVNPSSFPVSINGEYHYRSGATKQQLRGNALTNFLMFFYQKVNGKEQVRFVFIAMRRRSLVGAMLRLANLKEVSFCIRMRFTVRCLLWQIV